MKFLLVGHSFVRRVAGAPRGSLSFPISTLGTSTESVVLECFGEGGLSFDRIRGNPRRYVGRIRSSCPDILILDMGTNDLCRHAPREVFEALWEFLEELARQGVKPLATVLLPVLPRTSVHRSGDVPLEEFNQRVYRFNTLVQAEVLRRDCVWVCPHKGLRAPRYSLDGVHLNPPGMRRYSRTLRGICLFFRRHFWG